MKKSVTFLLIVGATTIGIACSLVSVKPQLVKQAVVNKTLN
ncbi:MAG TPA: hypothetical protein V6D15_04570 [Oculatellaceae cyanobacterium]|jgi:hypothetical protein